MPTLLGKKKTLPGKKRTLPGSKETRWRTRRRKNKMGKNRACLMAEICQLLGGDKRGKHIGTHGGHAHIARKEEDVAEKEEAIGGKEGDAEANKEEEEQYGGKQSGEMNWRRDDREPEPARSKESCTEKEGRGEGEQADAGRSGRHGGVHRVSGGTWLNQVHDRLCSHVGPVLRWVGKKGGEEAKNPKHAGLGHEG
ncbi:hypothetical protein NDU88_006372 [Pleurodeles waltl]|uniref:Uncharacterized protein n=1 Tax=Pleurodeles waltl TaxID=8319 RepID=A0AAV7SPA1_PLEWA|nr:hypothetical protein NDU88_006372 [Pleurodeles waltl]